MVVDWLFDSGAEPFFLRWWLLAKVSDDGDGAVWFPLECSRCDGFVIVVDGPSLEEISIPID